jgi:hypothetical protein
VPESIIPSADAPALKASRVSFQMLSSPRRSFCLRVSGAVAPSAPAREAGLSRRGCLEQIGGKHVFTKPVNATEELSTGFRVLQQVHDLFAQFLDTIAALV